MWPSFFFTRKWARRLVSNEKSLHRIIEDYPGSIVIIDKEGIIRFANHAAESLFGMTEKELVGSSFGFPLTESVYTEIEIISPSGMGRRVAEMHVTEMEWEGKPSYLASLFDITDKWLLRQYRLQLLYQVQGNKLHNLPLNPGL
jgi:PAS domain-containing protein